MTRPPPDLAAIQTGDVPILAGSEQDMLRASLSHAMEQDPDRAARVYSAARELGLPSVVVEDDPELFERTKKLSDITREEFGESLRTLLEDPERAALAHDDLDVLMGLEEHLQRGSLAWQLDRAGTTLGNIGKSVVSSIYSLSSGYLGLLETGADVASQAVSTATGGTLDLGLSDIADFLESRRKEGQAAFQNWLPRTGNETLDAIYSGLSSGAANAGLLVGSVATGNPAFALGAMTGMSAGSSMAEAKDQGLSPLMAASFGTRDGLIEYITERAPAFQLFKDLDMNSGFMKTVFNQMVGEVPMEQLAEFGQELNAWLYLPENREKTLADFGQERADSIYPTFVSTIAAVGFQTGVTYGANRLLREDEPDEIDIETGRVLGSAFEQEEIDTAIRLAQQSKLGGRAADVFEDFLRGAAQDQNIYVAPEMLEQVYTETPVPPDLAAQIDGSGADVVIPMETFLSGLALDENAMEILRPHIRMGLNSMSAADLESGAEANIQRLLDRASAAVDLKTEADEVWEEVRDQLVTSDAPGGEAVARVQAQLYPAFAAMKAKETGLSVRDVYERMNFTVTRDDQVAPDAQVIEQARAEGYEGNDRGESEEWLRAVAKGLDMSREARMERARAMGWDAPIWYRGAVDGKEATIPSFYTTDPRGASWYAEDRDGAVYPVMIKKGNDLDIDFDGYDELIEIAKSVGVTVETDPYFYAPDIANFSSYDGSNIIDLLYIPEIRNALISKGYDNVRVSDPLENQQIETIIPLKEGAVRSVNAAFDPDFSDSPNLLAQVDAWHGSGSLFDKFSSDFIGTGEGTQAFGRGLYFAEAQRVSKAYRGLKGGRIDPDDRFLYKVELNVDIDDLLHYDIPYEQQSESVRAKLDSLEGSVPDYESMSLEDLRFLLKRNDPNGEYDTDEDGDPLTREDLMDSLDYVRTMDDPSGKDFDDWAKGTGYAPGQSGGGILTQLEAGSGNPEVAAQRLLEAGIPGIRYLDGGSRAAGEGTYNYVIFDDSAVRIVETHMPDGTTRLAQPSITDFNDVQITEEVEVAETGERVTMSEPAERRYRQLTKRRNVVEQLLKCVRAA